MLGWKGASKRETGGVLSLHCAYWVTRQAAVEVSETTAAGVHSARVLPQTRVSRYTPAK